MIAKQKSSILISILLLGIAFFGGYFVKDSDHPTLLWPETTAMAAGGTQDDSFAMAIGRVDSNVEGVCILDFLTGELTCTVLDYRSGKFSSMFKANVIKDLRIEQAGRRKFLMLTGEVSFPRGAGAARAAQSAIYVLDSASGTYAAYGIPWRQELASGGRPQVGQLILLDVGTARTAALRE